MALLGETAATRIRHTLPFAYFDLPSQIKLGVRQSRTQGIHCYLKSDTCSHPELPPSLSLSVSLSLQVLPTRALLAQSATPRRASPALGGGCLNAPVLVPQPFLLVRRGLLPSCANTHRVVRLAPFNDLLQLASRLSARKVHPDGLLPLGDQSGVGGELGRLVRRPEVVKSGTYP